MTDFQIHSFCVWSDHAPLSYRILCNSAPVGTDDPQYRNRIKWDDSLCGDFRRSLIARLPDLNFIVKSTKSTAQKEIQ